MPKSALKVILLPKNALFCVVASLTPIPAAPLLTIILPWPAAVPPTKLLLAPFSSNTPKVPTPKLSVLAALVPIILP